LEYLNVGKIVNTQGLKGEVRVISQTDFPEERFKIGNQLFLFKDNREPTVLAIKTYRRHKNFDILSFAGLLSINDVKKYRDGVLKVSVRELAELGEHEFYYHEIIGLSVVTVFGEKIGEIKEIISSGANDVWVVKRIKGKDVLIPYIEPVVKKVDLKTGEVVIELMDGLIDDEN